MCKNILEAPCWYPRKEMKACSIVVSNNVSYSHVLTFSAWDLESSKILMWDTFTPLSLSVRPAHLPHHPKRQRHVTPADALYGSIASCHWLNAEIRGGSPRALSVNTTNVLMCKHFGTFNNSIFCTQASSHKSFQRRKRIFAAMMDPWVMYGPTWPVNADYTTLPSVSLSLNVHNFRMYLTCTAIPNLTCEHAACNAEGFKHSPQIQQVDQYPVCRTDLTCFSSTTMCQVPDWNKNHPERFKGTLAHLCYFCSSQNKLDQLIEAPNSVSKTRNESKETDCPAAIHTSIVDVPLTLYLGRKIWHLVVDVTQTWKAVQAHPPRCPEGLLICLAPKRQSLHETMNKSETAKQKNAAATSLEYGMKPKTRIQVVHQ